MILPRDGRPRPQLPFLPEALDPSDEPVPLWFWATALLCLAASATAYLSGRPLSVWAWVPAFAPSFLLLPWRGWKGAAAAGGFGALLVAVTGRIGLGAVPWNAVGTVAFASVGMATAEALRRRRWLATLWDPSTGLPSRQLTEVMLKHEVAAARRGRPLSVVLITVEEPRTPVIPLRPEPGAGGGAGAEEDDDGLALTLKVGASIRWEARSMDILGRYDEDRLLAVLPSEDTPGALAFARRMSTAAHRLFPPRGSGPTFFAGVASFERATADESELLEHASLALSEARRRGGGGILYHGREGYVESDPRSAGPGEAGPGTGPS
ncbi:MAG TPA: diguanylate cyclase [Gemmatimonadota bacterium]|nr:diguanylate cyclase [Gemmatimonadota bacterium]